jgi:Ni/Fe-hydrogenase b-type cytochrome subunit
MATKTAPDDAAMAGSDVTASPHAHEPGPMRVSVYRHRLATRLWHWINAVTIFVMIGTGLMILNAHPQLYWGQYGANLDTPWFRVGDWFAGGRFPGWLTIPSTYNLALARRWHLSFALILGFGLLIFMVASLLNRHFQRDMRIRARELTPGHLWADIKEHWAFRFHDPANPAAFNVLQKIAYAVAIFVLIPLVIFTGLAMSPGMNAAWPWLVDLFGGRQSARSLHFIAMLGIIGFIIVHLALVILAGAFNEVRSMITGRLHIAHEEPQA